jgi:DNA polymerase V
VRPIPLLSGEPVLGSLPAGVPVALRADPPPHPCALVGEAVAAGFPSPADDYIESRIDLNRELIPAPLSTFFMRVCGDAMRGDGIVDGDLLVIDRSLDPRPGRVVVAVHAGRFLVRRLVRRSDRLWLQASDGSSSPLPLPATPAEGGDPELWGVVTHAVHHLGGRPSAAAAKPP